MKSRILYIQYTNPAGYPPLEHSSRILAHQGWHILFLGVRAWRADSLEFPRHPQITVRRMPFVPHGWRQQVHYLAYCVWVVIWVLLWRPRWIYASDSLSCPIALFLSFFPSLNVIYHEHDAPPKGTVSFRQRIYLAARRELGPRAAMCVLPTQSRATLFRRSIPRVHHVACVQNCPARPEADRVRQPFDGPKLYAFYHGSIVPTQLPMTVINALARLPEVVCLQIAGYETSGHVGYVQELRSLAKTLGVGERFHFLGTASTRSELLEWCRSCDVGLALFPAVTRQPMVGASNKPFDYLACGLPVLVTDVPDWKQTYVDAGYGLACNPQDPTSIAAMLQWFLEHPDEMRQMGENGRQRILADWNYETQFQQVLNRLHM